MVVFESGDRFATSYGAIGMLRRVQFTALRVPNTIPNPPITY